MEIEIKVEVPKRLSRIPKDYRNAIIAALAIAGDLTQNETKRTVRFIDRTGNLRNSILRDKVNESELNVKVIAGMEYGIYVNDGTKNKDQTVRIVARRFMEEGLNKASSRFEAIMKIQLDRRI